MDWKVINDLGNAYINMLYGLDLLYMLRCAFEASDLEYGDKAASSVYIAWEWLNNASIEISHCLDALETNLRKKVNFDNYFYN